VTEPISEVAGDSWILGTWQLLRADASLELQQGARMHFGTDQRLEYTIPGPEGMLRVTLTWRLAGARLRTQLEDGSNPVEVGVHLDALDVMTFDFGGPRAWFVRAA
jgi:hypothetical protein